MNDAGEGNPREGKTTLFDDEHSAPTLRSPDWLERSLARSTCLYTFG
jgi:hypothetical protein